MEVNLNMFLTSLQMSLSWQKMRRQNRAQRLKDRQRENSQIGFKPLLGKTHFENWLDQSKSRPGQNKDITKSCPNIAMRHTLNREAAQDSQARGILKANQPTNQKSDLMQEVDLLGVVQDALVSKLVGHATDQAQVETKIHGYHKKEQLS